MKETCLVQVANDKRISSIYKVALEDAMSARKKAAKAAYLRALGYRKVLTVHTRGEDKHVIIERETEKEEIFGRCVRKGSNGLEDLSWWRTAPRGQLIKTSGSNASSGRGSAESEDRDYEAWSQVDIFSTTSLLNKHSARFGDTCRPKRTGRREIRLLQLCLLLGRMRG